MVVPTGISPSIWQILVEYYSRSYLAGHMIAVFFFQITEDVQKASDTGI